MQPQPIPVLSILKPTCRDRAKPHRVRSMTAKDKKKQRRAAKLATLRALERVEEVFEGWGTLGDCGSEDEK